MSLDKASTNPPSLGHPEVQFRSLTWMAAARQSLAEKMVHCCSRDVATCSKSSQRSFIWLGFLLEPCLVCVDYPDANWPLKPTAQVCNAQPLIAAAPGQRLARRAGEAQ